MMCATRSLGNGLLGPATNSACTHLTPPWETSWKGVATLLGAGAATPAQKGTGKGPRCGGSCCP